MCDVWREHVVNFRMSFLEQCAVVAGDAANHVRIDAHTVVGKNAEGGSVLEKI